MDAQEIVKVIEKTLTDRKISKTDFYKSCGLSAAVFSNWRHGKNLPSVKLLKQINEYLGTRLTLGADFDEEFTVRVASLSEQDRERVLSVLDLLQSNPEAARAAVDLAVKAAQLPGEEQK